MSQTQPRLTPYDSSLGIWHFDYLIGNLYLTLSLLREVETSSVPLQGLHLCLHI